jgi:hypothetical protein
VRLTAGIERAGPLFGSSPGRTGAAVGETPLARTVGSGPFMAQIRPAADMRHMTELPFLDAPRSRRRQLYETPSPVAIMCLNDIADDSKGPAVY